MSTADEGEATAAAPDAITEPAGAYPGIGTLLGSRYRLENILGTGGSGRVFRADDLLLQRAVAVKVFANATADPAARTRQRIEMTALAGLSHPNLVAIYDAHIDGWTIDDGADVTSGAHTAQVNSTYFVMELVQGRTLSQLMRESAITELTLRRLGAEIAAGLAKVHESGLVHRDIKPPNILVTVGGQAKLSDFGIAMLLDQDSVTSSGDIVGTAAYLSPEQARGVKVGPQSDVYSLGLVLLEVLTGNREFTGTAIEAAVARLLRDPVIPPELPDPWGPLLRSMTTADPADRPTAAQVATVLTGQGVLPPPEPTVSLPPPGSSAGAGNTSTRLDLESVRLGGADAERGGRRRWLWIMIGLLLTAVVVVAVWIGTASETDSPPSVPGVVPSTGTQPGQDGPTQVSSDPIGDSSIVPSIVSPDTTAVETIVPPTASIAESVASSAAGTTQGEAGSPSTNANEANTNANDGNGNGSNGNGNGNGSNGNGSNGNGNNGNGNGNGNNGNGNG